jgi:nucleoside-diphosphate-sugar epimerase
LKKTIFIIGSNSFSGSHFIKLVLNKGYKVIGVSRSKEYHSVYLPYKKEKKRMYEWNLTAKTIMSVKHWKKLFKEIGFTGDYYWFIP